MRPPIESSLRTEARYLNPTVSRFIESLFEGIDEHAANGVSVMVDAGPETPLSTLYRARVFESLQGLRSALQSPERELGALAAGLGKGGRLNAAGQPAFYGSVMERVAVAEVRPPVGSWVTVTEFAIKRPLKLLDLSLLERAEPKKGASLFDPATVAASQRRSFLRSLAARMTMPVMPENQDHGYLITQVVADYLATCKEVQIDGILYPSAQVPADDKRYSANVLLFHKAAITTRARLEGPTVSASAIVISRGCG